MAVLRTTNISFFEAKEGAV